MEVKQAPSFAPPADELRRKSQTGELLGCHRGPRRFPGAFPGEALPHLAKEAD